MKMWNVLYSLFIRQIVLGNEGLKRNERAMLIF